MEMWVSRTSTSSASRAARSSSRPTAGGFSLCLTRPPSYIAAGDPPGEQQHNHGEHERSSRNVEGRLQGPRPLTAARSSIAAARRRAMPRQQYPRGPAWAPSTRSRQAPQVDRRALIGATRSHRDGRTSNRGSAQTMAAHLQNTKWAQPPIFGHSGHPRLGQLSSRSPKPLQLIERRTRMSAAHHDREKFGVPSTATCAMLTAPARHP